MTSDITVSISNCIKLNIKIIVNTSAEVNIDILDKKEFEEKSKKLNKLFVEFIQ